MTLPTGARLGPYEIVAPLGAGGMGEVYRAKDPRLGREVAIKVLPEHLSSSLEMRQRFEREARTISQLSHPHICAIYDVGNQDGVEYLVMEYLEGQTLSDRLARGPFPLQQTLRHGIEIAQALDKAHRQGIVHRDLKPGNVMLTRSGAKLLDFGLARVLVPPGSADWTSLPTQASPVTQAGAVLGTFQYMAPEQLEGREADPRTDIFALGAVLYEMATGRKAFSATSQASLISAIMQTDPPPISIAQPMSPPALDRVVRTCLAKDPERRWQSAHDVGIELETVSDAARETSPPAPAARTRWQLAAVGGLAAILAAIALFALLRPRPRPSQATVRFNLDVPANALPALRSAVSISPDGSRILFSASDLSGRSRLYLRSLDSLESKPLPGTDDAFNPFWSPDGRQIGFFSRGKLRSIDLAGGRDVELADVGSPAGGAWMRDGRMIVGYYHGGFVQVPAGGGRVTPFLAVDSSRGETSHRWPHLLPDGNQLVFLSVKGTDPKASSIEVVRADGRSRRTLLRANSEGWVAGDFLVYAREGSLLAQHIDPKRLVLDGEPVIVQDPVGYNALFGAAYAGASDDVLVYRAPAGATRLVWLDRSGKELSSPGSPGPFAHMDLAPDGTHVALERADPHTGLGEIWIADLSRETFTPVTSGNDWNWKPIWSPDGSRLVFSSTRTNISDLYEKGNGGTGAESLFYGEPPRLAPDDFSRDGRILVFERLDKSGTSLWILPLTGVKKAVPAAIGPGWSNTDGCLSPDARLLAYTSHEGERPEVFVVPVPPTGERWQVSTRGGAMPRWRSDGRELFYIAPDRELMAVTVTPGAGFRVGVPQRLFEARIGNLNDVRRWYAPSPDGTRFLVLTTVDDRPPPITIVTGWRNSLRHTSGSTN